MEKISTISRTIPDEWNNAHTTLNTRYRITSEDVGMNMPNYLGYQYARHTFEEIDVDREIIVISDGTGWNCWSWKYASEAAWPARPISGDLVERGKNHHSNLNFMC